MAASSQPTRETNRLLRHFSLNARTSRAEMQRAEASTAAEDGAPPPPAPMSVAEQIVMYLGVVVGVVFQPILTQYRTSGAINFALPWGLLVVSLLIALVVTPSVYE